MDVILEHVKTVVGDPLTETMFNVELLGHINGCVAKLVQLGVTPYNGIFVEEDTMWPVIDNPTLKSLVMLFLPGTVNAAFDRTANETVRNSTAQYLSELEERIILEASLTYEV